MHFVDHKKTSNYISTSMELLSTKIKAFNVPSIVSVGVENAYLSSAKEATEVPATTNVSVRVMHAPASSVHGHVSGGRYFSSFFS